MYQSKWANPAPAKEATEKPSELTPQANTKSPEPAAPPPDASSGLQNSRWANPPAPATTTAPTAPAAPEEPMAPPQTSSPRPTSSHQLSAAAPSFAPVSPSLPPPDVSTVDEFAQTGAQQDDLFDDIVPVEESMQTRPPDDLFGDEFTPVEEPVVEQPAPQPTRVRNEEGRGRGRGRGRGGRKDSYGQAGHGPREQRSGSIQAEAQAPENAPTGPRKETPASVRGNRQATGGVRKPKLTEDELAEKMASIKLKNASLTAAHARAEADAAQFAEREEHAKAKAAVRQKEERRDRQQMMGERERNRMRKLKAMEGREWDMEKNEDDFSRGGRYDKKGGFAGDKEDYTDGREYMHQEPRARKRESRGGKEGQASAQTQNKPPKQEDFPSLPGKTAEATPVDFEKDAGTAGKSWADQVESG